MRISWMKMRACRMVTMLLMVAWLPYMSTRCLENPLTHAGCPMFPAVASAAHPGHHGGRDSAMAHHHGHAHHDPGHTCCDLTGKCNVRVIAATPPLDAPAVTAVLPAAPASLVVLGPRIDQLHSVSLVAHSPPTYLRNASLLL